MSLQLFDFNDHNVRVVIVDGEPWWIAKDVCSVLEIKDPSTAVSNLDDDESGTATIGTSGQNRDMVTVSESGLYSLVLRSRKPQAKAFKKWLTSVVIPSIRKTGSYNIPKPFDRSTLPPTDVRMVNLASSLEYFQIDISNPRYKQSIQDLVINGIMGDTPSLPSADRWAGVAEIAEQMGYPVRVVTNHRSALGKFVALHPLESKKEIRLCNGTQRPINVYLDCPQLRSVIAEFLDTKGVAS